MVARKSYKIRQPLSGRTDYTLIRISWAASGSLLKLRLYDFNDYDDDWTRF